MNFIGAILLFRFVSIRNLSVFVEWRRTMCAICGIFLCLCIKPHLCVLNKIKFLWRRRTCKSTVKNPTHAHIPRMREKESKCINNYVEINLFMMVSVCWGS